MQEEGAARLVLATHGLPVIVPAGRLDFGYFDRDRVVKFFDSSTAMQGYLATFDLYPRLAAIRCPVLIIHGETDPVSIEAMTRLKGGLPNATLEIVNG